MKNTSLWGGLLLHDSPWLDLSLWLPLWKSSCLITLEIWSLVLNLILLSSKSRLTKPWFHSSEVEDAFHILKEELTNPPTLRLPNFTQRFVIECDASETGIRAVLTQYNHPVAYFSEALKDQLWHYPLMRKKWWQLSRQSKSGILTCWVNHSQFALTTRALNIYWSNGLPLPYRHTGYPKSLGMNIPLNTRKGKRIKPQTPYLVGKKSIPSQFLFQVQNGDQHFRERSSRNLFAPTWRIGVLHINLCSVTRFGSMMRRFI